MLLDKLIEFGLSDKEAKVYAALLELGSSTVTDIARRAHVTRTNAYHLLNALLSYGLVSTNESQAKMIYTAESPDRFVYFMREKLAEAERKYKEAQEMLPEMKSVFHDPDQKIRVRYFEGAEGLITAYEDTLTSRTDILAYASVEQQHAFFPGYFPEYYERRTSKGIHVQCILAESPASLRIKGLDKKHIRKSFMVPKDFSINMEINIYDDKTAILSLKEKFGVIVESREVTDAFRKLFKLAYERAEEYDPKVMPKLVAEQKKRKLA